MFLKLKKVITDINAKISAKLKENIVFLSHEFFMRIMHS